MKSMGLEEAAEVLINHRTLRIIGKQGKSVQIVYSGTGKEGAKAKIRKAVKQVGGKYNVAGYERGERYRRSL